ncbi:recombinase family protein, partial [Salmonella enterica]|uniref:recombinase family protein n=1 Tax=Salmonella enterica TaxID=28901 RepID=UPI00307E49D8
MLRFHHLELNETVFTIMALYGYARVSTSDQDLTLQTQILRAAGCEIIGTVAKLAMRQPFVLFKGL